jgi:signal peptide peptidase SppA
MRNLSNVISLIEDHWMIIPSMIEKYKRVVEGIDQPGYQARRADFLRNREEGDEDFSAEFFAAQPGRRIDSDDSLLLRRMGATLTSGGTAILPIHGTLMKRPMFSLSVKLTSSDMVRNSVRELARMSGVRSIVLDVDSPGGSVLGIERAAQAVAEVASEMRVVAVANEMMASGGYYLSAPATEILTVESSIIGSVGVYTTRIDRVEEAEMAGWKVYIIRAGEHKAEGHPFLPFSDGERERLQREVDYYYNMFVTAVANGRGVSRKEALSLADGTIEVGQQAVERGFADGIASLAEAAEREDDRNNTNSRRTVMFGKKNGTAESAETPKDILMDAAGEYGWSQDDVLTHVREQFGADSLDDVTHSQATLTVVSMAKEALVASAMEDVKEKEAQAERKAQEVAEREAALSEKERAAELRRVRSIAHDLTESGHVLPRNADVLEAVLVAAHEADVTIETEDDMTGEMSSEPIVSVIAAIFEDQGKLIEYGEVASKPKSESQVSAKTGAEMIADYAAEHGVSVSEAKQALKSQGYVFK